MQKLQNFSIPSCYMSHSFSCALRPNNLPCDRVYIICYMFTICLYSKSCKSWWGTKNVRRVNGALRIFQTFLSSNTYSYWKRLFFLHRGLFQNLLCPFSSPPPPPPPAFSSPLPSSSCNASSSRCNKSRRPRRRGFHPQQARSQTWLLSRREVFQDRKRLTVLKSVLDDDLYKMPEGKWIEFRRSSLVRPSTNKKYLFTQYQWSVSP